MIDWLVDILSYQVGSPLMFNSRMFWLLFIVFLPFYGLLSIRRNRMAMIVYVIVFSLFFYYKASGLCCLLLVARAVIDYYFVQIMDDSPNPRLRKALLVLSLLLSVGTLAFFKYTNFLLFNLDIIDKTFTSYKKGQLFDGVVVMKRTDGVIFNIGGKNDAFIPASDFEDFDAVKIV